MNANIGCSICLEAFDSSTSTHKIVTPCGHIYHERCLEQWISKTGERHRCCPDCRQPTQMSQAKRVFFHFFPDRSHQLQSCIDDLNVKIAAKNFTLQAIQEENRLLLEKLDVIKDKALEVEHRNGSRDALVSKTTLDQNAPNLSRDLMLVGADIDEVLASIKEMELTVAKTENKLVQKQLDLTVTELNRVEQENGDLKAMLKRIKKTVGTPFTRIMTEPNDEVDSTEILPNNKD